MVRACFLRIRACMQVTVEIFNENKNYKLLINGTKPCNATVCAYNRYTVYLSGPPRGTALITDGFSVFFAPKTYRHKQPMLPWQSFWASVAAIVIFILTCPLVDKIRNRWQDQATFTVISPFARTHSHTHCSSHFYETEKGVSEAINPRETHLMLSVSPASHVDPSGFPQAVREDLLILAQVCRWRLHWSRGVEVKVVL